MLLCRFAVNILQHRVHQLDNRAFGQLQLDFACIYLDIIENIINHLQQFSSATLDHFNCFRLLPVQWTIGTGMQDLRHTDHRSQRRTQFVAHCGKKLVFQPGGLGQFLIGPLQISGLFGNFACQVFLQSRQLQMGAYSGQQFVALEWFGDKIYRAQLEPLYPIVQIGQAAEKDYWYRLRRRVLL